MVQMGQALFGNNSQSRNHVGIWGMQARRRNVLQPYWSTPLMWEDQNRTPCLGAGRGQGDILQSSPRASSTTDLIFPAPGRSSGSLGEHLSGHGGGLSPSPAL